VYVVDTNIISAVMRAEQGSARAWIDAAIASELHLTATTVYEITRGLALLPHGRRRERLEQAWETDVLRRFEGRVLPLDADAARIWGQLVADRSMAGATPPMLDSQFAAIAITHDMTVVTLDRGFRQLGCKLLILS
jgi:predicted nucleic acid-binding protein